MIKYDNSRSKLLKTLAVAAGSVLTAKTDFGVDRNISQNMSDEMIMTLSDEAEHNKKDYKVIFQMKNFRKIFRYLKKDD